MTKDVLEHANTRYAQGGIAGVMFDDDRAEDHIRDTLTAGAGLSDPEAVRVLVDEGPARIRELIALGVAFDRGADGAFVKGLEAAHSYPRILHSGGDATGTAIEKALVARLRASDVRVIEHAFLVDLVLDEGASRGRAAGRRRSRHATDPHIAGRRERVEADAVVLATGGAGELYAHTTNPAVATGDGIAAALRAGAEVTDLEFFQFHPTVLEQAAPPVCIGESFLVSEAVRGEGATLIDEHGRRFAFDAHPDGELAPRDVVARAIARQMEAQDGRPVLPRRHAPARDSRRAARVPRAPLPHDRPRGARPRAGLGARADPGDARRALPDGRRRPPTSPAARRCPASTPSARSPAPACTARTGSRRTRCSRAPCSAPAPATRSPRTRHPASGPARSAHAPVAASRRLAPSARTRTRPPAPFTRAALQELMWEDAGLVRDDRGTRARGIRHRRAGARTPRTPTPRREFEDENLLLVAEQLVAAALRAPRVGRRALPPRRPRTRRTQRDAAAAAVIRRERESPDAHHEP